MQARVLMERELAAAQQQAAARALVVAKEQVGGWPGAWAAWCGTCAVHAALAFHMCCESCQVCKRVGAPVCCAEQCIV